MFTWHNCLLSELYFANRSQLIERKFHWLTHNSSYSIGPPKYVHLTFWIEWTIAVYFVFFASFQICLVFPAHICGYYGKTLRGFLFSSSFYLSSSSYNIFFLSNYFCFSLKILEGCLELWQRISCLGYQRKGIRAYRVIQKDCAL